MEKVILAIDDEEHILELLSYNLEQNGYRVFTATSGEEGLEILEKGIETNKRNFTRFLILADPLMAQELRPKQELLNKASLVFTLPHTNGALSKVLTIFSFYDINLSKIQSLPIIGREWEYRFYIDVTFDSYIRYHQAIQAVRPLMNDFKNLGEYVEFK